MLSSAVAAGVAGFLGSLVGSLVIMPRADGSIVVSIRPLRFLYAKTITVTTEPRNFLDPGVKALLVKADGGNTDDVFVGNAAVTPSNGFQLQKEEAISMNVDNAGDIFVVAKSGNQKIHVIALG